MPRSTCSADSSIRATLCRRRLERVIAIDTETAELKRQISKLVAAADTTLTDLYGVGPLVAARFIAEVVDIRRYPNRNAFADQVLAVVEQGSQVRRGAHGEPGPAGVAAHGW